MKTIQQILGKATTPSEFASEYFLYVSELLSHLDTAAITAFIEQLELARRENNTVFIAGNGGSAATASHMANDFGIGSRTGNGAPFRALALTDNVAVMTAIANDDSYERVFVEQLRVHYRSGDKLVAISGSGNSPNVVAAAEWMKKRAGTVLGLVGFDGGRLKDLCDVVIHVQTPVGEHEEYGPVEDIHMILDHLVATWLRWRVQRDAST